MTFQKSCSTHIKGFIILDAVLALSLAAVFISILASSSIGSRDVVLAAQDKSAMLDSYEVGASSTVLKRVYGNERIEIVTTTEDISFSSLKPASSVERVDAQSDPLCSVDFSNHAILGSYQSYLENSFSTTSTNISNISTSTVIKIVLPIPTTIPLTRVEVRNGIAYVSTDSTQASDPDLYVIDIHNSTSPVIVSSVNTGPGIASFVLAGEYIFAAAASTAAQLHVIQLSNTRILSLLNKYQLPLPYATATPPFATAIGYENGYVYLGTEKWDSNEFNVIDLASPSAPRTISGLEMGNKVGDILLHNGYAYVVAAGEGQLRIVDVRIPNSPIVTQTFSPSGWNRQEGNTASVFENKFVFGRTAGGYDIPADHELFTWATATSSFYTATSSLSAPSSMNVPNGVYGIIQDRLHTYFATRKAGQEVGVLNTASSFLGTSTTTVSLLDTPESMTCDGAHIYVLSHNSPTLYDISFK